MMTWDLSHPPIITKNNRQQPEDVLCPVTLPKSSTHPHLQHNRDTAGAFKLQPVLKCLNSETIKKYLFLDQ